MFLYIKIGKKIKYIIHEMLHISKSLAGREVAVFVRLGLIARQCYILVRK